MNSQIAKNKSLEANNGHTYKDIDWNSVMIIIK